MGIKAISVLPLAAALIALAMPRALAQRAEENAVAEATDAFGTSVGREQIGIYSPDNVRGFSPTRAGNIRIEGLYFDQVASLSPRIENSSQIHVGIAAQGYAFPAPTGVVDYSLRVPGAAAHLSALAEGDTRGTTSLEVDGAFPLLAETLALGGGVGVFHYVDGSGASDWEPSEGAMARWQPLPGLEVLPFWSRTDLYDVIFPLIYIPSTNVLPPTYPGRHNFAPDWTSARTFEVNTGLVSRYAFADAWELRLGIFRSSQKQPHSYFQEIENLTPQGFGELNVFSDPPSERASTSGEMRLEHTMTDGVLVHRAVLSLRARSYNAVYGGTDVVDLGLVGMGARLAVLEPKFQYTAQTRDHIATTTPGFSYQLAWDGVGSLGVGVEKPNYRKNTHNSGQPDAMSHDSPLLFNAAVSANVFSRAVFYADYTEGLEDNGVAPGGSANHNQALPAIATNQKDAGLRYAITPDMRLVAGIFDIRRPYFDLGPGNIYGSLGKINNKGIELSLNGEVLPRLNVSAGVVFAEPRLTGEAVRLGLVGHRPIGMPSQQLDVNLNWKLPSIDDFIFGLEINRQSNTAAVLDDSLTIPGRTLVNADVRYAFKLDGQSASLRLWLENAFDQRGWDTSSAGRYLVFGNSGRHIDLRLIVDM